MYLHEVNLNRPRALITSILVMSAIFVTPMPSLVEIAHADPGVTIKANGENAGTVAANDPMAQVKTGVSDVIDVFKAPDTPLKVRREKLRDLGAKYFDFESMTKSVMGYHWRQITPAQRIEVVGLFTAFINNAYLSKLQDYSVKKVSEELPTVNIQFTRETFDGPEYAEVYSTITLKEQKSPLEVNYLMHLTNGQWKVYDVTVDAISVISNYRNQFNRVMNDGGYDRLAADLRSKTVGLQQQLDNPNPQSHQSN